MRRAYLAVLLGTLACTARSLDYLQEGDTDARTGGSSSVGDGDSSAGAAGSSSGGAAGSSPVGTCVDSADCASRVCRDGLCAAPTCDDEVQNGSESDVDCGGNSCERCADGSSCVYASDCAGYSCVSGKCGMPSCSDGVVNGEESDVDCGGSCSACPDGKRCVNATDCQSATCEAGTCKTPCADGTSCSPLDTETAYELTPSFALDRCADVWQESTDNGARLVSYPCATAPNQAFWAVARGDGWYELRGAGSGKCISVSYASVSSGAGLIQWRCNGTDDQLWQARPVGDGLYRLVVKHSGLSLDVAGVNDSTPGARLVTSTYDGSPDMHWRLTQKAGHVVIKPVANLNLALRHRNSNQVFVERCTGLDCEWKVLPGLASLDCVSFESRTLPGHYLRHRDGYLRNDPYVAGIGFEPSATFCLQFGFNTSFSCLSFAPLDARELFAFAQDDEGIVSAYQSDVAWANSASWLFVTR